MPESKCEPYKQAVFEILRNAGCDLALVMGLEALIRHYFVSGFSEEEAAQSIGEIVRP